MHLAVEYPAKCHLGHSTIGMSFIENAKFCQVFVYKDSRIYFTSKNKIKYMTWQMLWRCRYEIIPRGSESEKALLPVVCTHKEFVHRDNNNSIQTVNRAEPTSVGTW